MARYISKAGSFKKTVRPAKSTLVQTSAGPVLQVTEQPVIAVFTRGGITAYEKALALERFQFKGLSEGEDPMDRISIFDTEEQKNLSGWDDALCREAEQRLDKDQGSDYFRVEFPKAERPWATYDEMDEDEILRFAKDGGFDHARLAAYERENKNRESLLEALEALFGDEEIVV